MFLLYIFLLLHSLFPLLLFNLHMLHILNFFYSSWVLFLCFYLNFLHFAFHFENIRLIHIRVPLILFPQLNPVYWWAHQDTVYPCYRIFNFWNFLFYNFDISVTSTLLVLNTVYFFIRALNIYHILHFLSYYSIFVSYLNLVLKIALFFLDYFILPFDIPCNSLLKEEHELGSRNWGKQAFCVKFYVNLSRNV